MPKQKPDLDSVFRALADPTRRAVVQRLGRGPATVTELSQAHNMALPSFVQHLKVLETSGLIRSFKRGRIRTCELAEAPLSDAEKWFSSQRELWEARLDRLDDYLEKLNTGNKS